MKTILMSIHKEPFEALLDGRKKHEFRRRFYLSEPCQVVFYVSSPTQAICGVGIFDRPIRGKPDELAKIIKKHSFSSPENLRRYLEGVSFGWALPLTKIKKVQLITLDELREDMPKFRPPQSYCYFNRSTFHKYLVRLELYETPDEII